MNFCPSCGCDLTKFNQSVKVDPFDSSNLDNVKELIKDKLDKADDAVKLVKDIGTVMADVLKNHRRNQS